VSGRIACVVLGLSGTLAGCAVHRVGLLTAEDGPVVLQSLEGQQEKLLLVGDSTRLRQLDGHLVELDGRKGFGRIEVSTWRVLEGPHGLPVWVGPVQRLGMQVGIEDMASQMLVFVDKISAQELRGLAGDWVAAEGYIDGPQQVQVLHWRALDEPLAGSDQQP
jgi:hypothetical protein